MIITNSAGDHRDHRGLRREEHRRDRQGHERRDGDRSGPGRVDLDVFERIAGPHAAPLATTVTAARSRARRVGFEHVGDLIGISGAFTQNFGDDGRDLGPRDATVQERVDRDLIAELQLLMGAGEDVVISTAEEFPMDRRANKAAMSGDVNATVRVHEACFGRGR